MAWKASGAVVPITQVDIPPTHPITTPGAKAQYAAALVSATTLCGLSVGTGDFTVDMVGNGEAYPTARVTITVTEETTYDSGLSFSGKSHVNSAAEVAKIICVPTLTPGSLESTVWAALVEAAQNLITNGMIGNIRPYEVRLSGDTSAPTFTAVCEVQRPVAEGYAH